MGQQREETAKWIFKKTSHCEESLVRERVRMYVCVDVSVSDCIRHSRDDEMGFVTKGRR